MNLNSYLLAKKAEKLEDTPKRKNAFYGYRSMTVASTPQSVLDPMSLSSSVAATPYRETEYYKEPESPSPIKLTEERPIRPSMRWVVSSKESVKEFDNMVKPHSAEIAREGWLWTNSPSGSWNRMYAIITYTHQAMPIIQLYEDEQDSRPLQVLDLQSCSNISFTDEDSHYKPIYEFKLFMDGNDPIFGCDSKEECKDWILALDMHCRKKTMKESQSEETLLSDKRSMSQQLDDLETGLVDLTESMEKRTSRLGKMVHELLQRPSDRMDQFNQLLHQLGADMLQQWTQRLDALGLTTQNQLHQLTQMQIDQFHQSKSAFESFHSDLSKHGNAFEVQTMGMQELAASVQELKTRLVDEWKYEDLQSKLDSILEVCDFVSQAQCRLVDLMTGKMKDTEADSKSFDMIKDISIMMQGNVNVAAETKNELLKAIHESKEKTKSVFEEMKQSLDGDVKETTLNTQKALSLLEEIQSKAQSSDQDEMKHIHSLLVTLNNRMNGLNSFLSQPSYINDSIGQLTDLAEEHKIMSLNRLQSIEEKVRHISNTLLSVLSTKPVTDSSEVKVSTELKSHLQDLECGLNRMSRENKTSQDLMHGWLQRIHDSVKHTQKQIQNVGMIHEKESSFDSPDAQQFQAMMQTMERVEKKVTESYRQWNELKENQTPVAHNHDISQSLDSIQHTLARLLEIMTPGAQEYTLQPNGKAIKSASASATTQDSKLDEILHFVRHFQSPTKQKDLELSILQLQHEKSQLEEDIQRLKQERDLLAKQNILSSPQKRRVSSELTGSIGQLLKNALK